MVLLQTDASQLTFNIKDVVAICAFIFSVAGYVIKSRYDKEKTNARIDVLEKGILNSKTAVDNQINEFKSNIDGQIVGLRNSKRNLKNDVVEVRKEMVDFIEKREAILVKRIDKLQQEAKEDRKNTADEFTAVNTKLGEILGGIGELKGMISKNDKK